MWGTVTLSLFSLAVFLFLLWRKKQFEYLEKLGIPGPKPNILFGNVLEIYKKGPITCVHQWIEKYGKVFGYYLGKTPVICITEPDLLKQIQIKDFQNFINRSGLFQPSRKPNDTLGQTLNNIKGLRWKKVRGILTPSFTTGKLKTMSPIINEAIEELLSNIERKSKTGKPFDVFQLYQALTIDVIGRCALGIHTDVQKDAEEHDLVKSARIIFSPVFQSLMFVFMVTFPEIINILFRIRSLHFKFINKGVNPIFHLLNMCIQVIEARKADISKRRPDLLQLMIDSQNKDIDMKNVTGEQLTVGDESDTCEQRAELSENGPEYNKTTNKSIGLTDAEIQANAFIALLAGYETTSASLGFITHLLVQYPEVQEKMRKEVDKLIAEEGENLDYAKVHKLQYMDQVLSESLRLYPPVYLFITRKANKEVQYGSLCIPSGMIIQVPVHHVHYDPSLWPNPEKFDPERFSPDNRPKINPLSWQPFGQGPRNCIGMRFAQMEVKHALARILHNYHLVPCEKTEKRLTIKYATVTQSPLKGVYAKFLPRTHQE